jgi:hypothetical protein
MEDNIKLDHYRIGCGDTEWPQLAKDFSGDDPSACQCSFPLSFVEMKNTK